MLKVGYRIFRIIIHNRRKGNNSVSYTHLDVYKRQQVEKTKYEPTKVGFIRSYVPVPDTDEDSVKAAAELINNAERPLVLVGQGVELGNAQSELREFIEKADMPAGCTLLGLSALPTEHPLNKGMLGMHGNLGPNIDVYKRQRR